MNTTLICRIFVLAIFIFPSPYVVVSLGGSASPTMFFGLAMGALWAASRLSKTLSAARGRQPLRIAAAIFVLSVIASIGAAFSRILATEELNAPLRGLVITLSFVGVTLFLADGLRTKRDVEKVISTFVWGGAIMAGLGIFQFFTLTEIAPLLKLPGLNAVGDIYLISERNGLPRVASTAAHPIEYGLMLCVLWPFSFRHAVMNWVKRASLIHMIPFLVISFGLLTAMSRTAVIALGVIIISMWFTWPSARRFRLVAGFILFTICTFLIAPKLPSSLISLFTKADQDISISTRTEDYAHIPGLVRGHLLFGRGIKTFSPQLYFFLDNQFLLSFIETGIIGLLCLLGLFITGVTLARNVRHYSKNKFTAELGQCIASGLIAIMLCFATFDTLSFPMISFTSMFLIGVAGALWRINRYENGDETMQFEYNSSRVMHNKEIDLTKDDMLVTPGI